MTSPADSQQRFQHAIAQHDMGAVAAWMVATETSYIERRSALAQVVNTGDLAMLAAVLKRLHRLGVAEDIDYRYEALEAACRDGSLAAARWLVEHGANPAQGEARALRLAAIEGHTAIVGYLLTRPGVEGHAVHDEALRQAWAARHLDVVALLAPLARDHHVIYQITLESMEMDAAGVVEQMLTAGHWHITLHKIFDLRTSDRLDAALARQPLALTERVLALTAEDDCEMLLPLLPLAQGRLLAKERQAQVGQAATTPTVRRRHRA